MKYLWMLGCGLLLTACDEGAITTQPKEVQKGFFRQASCALQVEDMPHIDTCLCKADMQGITVSQKQVQDALSAIEAKNKCEGDKVAEPEADLQYNIVEGVAKVTRNDDRYFAVVYDFHAFSAGAAHGRSWLEPVIYDRKTNTLIAQKDVVPEAARKKVNTLIIQQLLVKNKSEYDNTLTLDHNNLLATFVKEEGCELCVMYPVEGGWEFAFNEYSIGSYSTGIVKVQLADEDMGR